MIDSLPFSKGCMILFLLGIMIGLPAPYFYAAERIKGFVRFALGKLPYEPPQIKGKKDVLEDEEDGDE